MFFLQSCVYSLRPMIEFRSKHSNEMLRRILSILLIPAGVVKYVYRSLNCCFTSYKGEHKCAVVLIIKNEGRYIKEFVEFYTALGCDIIIYDNDSDDGFQEAIGIYKNVTIIRWSGKKRQTDAYNHACNEFKDSYEYLMFFDADEFLVSKKMLDGNLDLYSILNPYFEGKNTAGVGINWLIFGSSGLVDYPEGGVLESFVNCASDDFEWNQLVKTCVRPRLIMGWVNPHVPLPVAGCNIVNTDGHKIKSPRNELPINREIRLHHYFVKNRKHFEEKVNKGKADRSDKRSMSEFDYYNKNDIVNRDAVHIKELINCRESKDGNRKK